MSEKSLQSFGRILCILTVAVSLVAFPVATAPIVWAQEAPADGAPAPAETPPDVSPPPPGESGGTSESTPPPTEGSGESTPPPDSGNSDTPPSSDGASPPGDGASPVDSETPPSGSGSGDGNIIIEETPSSELPGQGGSAGAAENGGGGGTLIVTGDAHAAANVVNVVNTNILDSQGFLAFLNMFGPYLGNVTVENLFFPLDGSCEGCTGTAFDIANLNNANVINDLLVAAISGMNVIRNGNGTSTIVTGSAAAAANLVNIVNTNIVGSNYLLLMVNNFNDWVGDLIFPGKEFFENFLTTASGIPGGGSLTLGNENSATIGNDIGTDAATGENTVEGSSATIVTGDAQSAANTHTIANTNILDNTTVFVLVRVFGTWSGNVFGTPPGLAWEQTPDGIVLHNIPDAGGQANCCNGSTTIQNTNLANVQNRVRVFALTGANLIQGAGSGFIETGNARAVANTVNLVNTNIVGRNWLFAVINIFGNWVGNLAFGQPDLWVGERANVVSGPLLPNTEVTYTIDIVNRGNADATAVRVRGWGTPADHSRVRDFGGGSLDGNNISWIIPRIPPGGSVQLVYTATVSDALPFGVTQFENTVEAMPREPDANPADNVDVLAFAFQGPKAGSGILPSDIKVTKSNNATRPIDPTTEMVSYKIVLKNEGDGWANDIIVRDTLFDPWGTTVSTSTWFLGQVAPHEEIIITYDADFATNASSGYYYNYVSLEGYDNYKGTFTPGYVASSTVYLVNPNEPVPVTTGSGGVIFVPPPPPLPAPEGLRGGTTGGDILSLLRVAEAGGEEHPRNSIHAAAFAARQLGLLEQSSLLASLAFLSLEIWDNILLLILLAAAITGYRLRSWL